jgi:hypothetical protein
MARFYLRKLNDVGIRERCHVKISNRILALENLDGDDDVNIGWTWERIVENIKDSVTESVLSLV